MTAVGLIWTRNDVGAAKLKYRSSMFEVPEGIRTALGWGDTTPDMGDEEEMCVALKTGTFVALKCDDDAFGEPGSTDVSMKHLGYVCEARLTETVEYTIDDDAAAAGQACVFPFRHLGKTYDACAVDVAPPGASSFPTDGSVSWCATLVGAVNKDAVEWGVCEDERAVVYAGNPQGALCQLPFFMGGQFYQTCTRHDQTRLWANRRDEYWCPSPSSVDGISRDWFGSHVDPYPDDDDESYLDSFGLCPDFLHPPDNGCDDHYEAVMKPFIYI